MLTRPKMFALILRGSERRDVVLMTQHLDSWWHSAGSIECDSNCRQILARVRLVS
jgi:hypothetical protein